MGVMTEAQKRKMNNDMKSPSLLHAAQAKRLEKTLEKAPKKKK